MKVKIFKKCTDKSHLFRFRIKVMIKEIFIFGRENKCSIDVIFQQDAQVIFFS